jgi:hypothetical protein
MRIRRRPRRLKGPRPFAVSGGPSQPFVSDPGAVWGLSFRFQSDVQ